MNELADLVGPFWSAERVRAALDLPDTVSLEGLVRRRDLLGVSTADGVVVYPVSQFRGQAGTFEVVPAVRVLLRRLSALDGWTTALILAAPQGETGGRTPVNWAREHGFDETLERLTARLTAELRHGGADGEG